MIDSKRYRTVPAPLVSVTRLIVCHTRSGGHTRLLTFFVVFSCKIGRVFLYDLHHFLEGADAGVEVDAHADVEEVGFL